MFIKYQNYNFFFPLKKDSAWFNLDHLISSDKDAKLKINADREVYATLFIKNMEIEGYIVEREDYFNPISDNYPIEEKADYRFRKLKQPGYYL